MPKIEKKSTLLRQWEMMRMLTISRSSSKYGGRWDKASDIAIKLNDAGYQVSVRTVQRDLKELSEIFPIELNDRNPKEFGWRWISGANLDIPGMSISEALAMRLVETHMKQMLPISMLDGLQGIFQLAQRKLNEVENQNGIHTKEWLDKVKVVPPAQPLLLPIIEPDVQAELYRALLENKQVSASYRPISESHAKTYVLHPLGLIMRGAITYLVASAWNYDEARLYALHRFNSVEKLDSAVKIPEGFSLDTAIAKGMADFATRGEAIKLELRCTDDVAAYLSETPLSADQEKEQDGDGWVRITATVNDTWQLRWWLMGQGASLEVCAPIVIRNAIKDELREAASLYL